MTDTPPDAAPLLEIHNATIYRERHRVFHNFSLEIPAGQSTVILGPNGAGKTTLLMVLARQLYPVERVETRLRILGRERWNLFDLRRELGVISSDLQREHPRLVRGREVVLSGFFGSEGTYEFQRLGPAENAAADRIAEELELGPLLTKAFGRMSTGEQRRVLLARALVADPPTLLLDEPTSGLDLSVAFDLLMHLRRLAQAGRHLLLITHDLAEVPPEIDNVVLLKAGEVFATGPKEELFTHETLSALYDRRVEVTERRGWYHVIPR